MTIQGPYGLPPSPLEAVIFVIGGVGVTPCLSLVGEARRKCGSAKVKLFWSCRSAGLLKKCIPMLAADGLEEANACIQCTSTIPEEQMQLPVQKGRRDLYEWMSQADSDFGTAGVTSVLVFACGPEAMVKQAGAFVSSKGKSVQTWQFHAEEFRFLPSKGGQQSAKSAAVAAQTVGVPHQ